MWCSPTNNGVGDALDVLFWRRSRFRLCQGPSEVALRLLRWSYLSQSGPLASETADDTTQNCGGSVRLRGTCRVQMDKLPNLVIKLSQSSPKRLGWILVFSKLP